MPIALNIGASLTGVTVKLNELDADKTGTPVSVTMKVKFETPLASAAGFTVAVQFGAVPPKTTFATGTTVVFVEAADIDVEQFMTLSTSVMVKLITTGVSSLVVWFRIELIAGASFTDVTVKLNVVAAD